MNTAIQLGPLNLSLGVLVFMAMLFGALTLGQALAKRRGLQVEGLLYQVALVGLVVARLAFVLRYRDSYLAEPLAMLDVRDGGWNWAAGLLGAALYAVVLAQRRRALRVPLAGAMGLVAVVWLGVTVHAIVGQTDGRPLPDTTLVSLDARQVPLNRAFVGKPTVVNLWATWCPPCRREMPVFARAQQARPDVHFVFANQGEGADKVVSYLRQHGLQLDNVLFDVRGELATAFDTRALPSTLFFDAQGRLVATRIGELSDATLNHWLAQATQGADKP